jgi:hypothetical protein
MNVKLACGVNLDVTLLGCDCFLCHNTTFLGYLLFSGFLLVSDGFLASLAGTGVVLG